MFGKQGEYRPLAFKVTVDGSFGDADFPGNSLDRNMFTAILNDDFPGSIYYLLLPYLGTFVFLNYLYILSCSVIGYFMLAQNSPYSKSKPQSILFFPH